MDSYRKSLYCWLVLFIFIALTSAFMVNFYQRSIAEISATSAIVIQNRLDYQKINASLYEQE